MNKKDASSKKTTTKEVKPLSQSEKLDHFIGMYNLGDVKEVQCESSGKGLRSYFQNTSKNLTGTISVKNFKMDKGLIPINNTKQLLKMLSVLKGHDVDITLTKNDEKEVVSMNVVRKDGKCKFDFLCGYSDDVGEVEEPPTFEPETQVRFNVDSMADYIRCFDSLNCEDITFTMIDDKLQIKIEDDDSRNQMYVPLDVVKTDWKDDIQFNGSYLKQIFNSNSDCEKSEILVGISNDGYLALSFNYGDFKSDYTLIGQENLETDVTETKEEGSSEPSSKSKEKESV